MKPGMTTRMKTRLLILAGVLAAAGVLISQTALREHVGPLPDGGSSRSNSGWRNQSGPARSFRWIRFPWPPQLRRIKNMRSC